MALCFEEDGSILGVDDIYTFIRTYFFSAIQKTRKEIVRWTFDLGNCRLQVCFFVFLKPITFWSAMCSNFFILCRTNQTAWTPLPVNRSKSVEVLQREAVRISEAIQLPEIVQVSPAILPQSRNFIERPDNAAAFRACLSDHRHAAAAAHTCCCKLLCPAQRQRHRATPNTPLGHLNNKKMLTLLYLQQLLWLCQGHLVQKEGGERLVYRVGPPFCPDQGFLVEPHRIDQRTDYDRALPHYWSFYLVSQLFL